MSVEDNGFDDTFYDRLPVTSDFAHLASGKPYRAVPDDWVLGLADIVASTDLIEKGQYKTVNTIGAAVISAQINALSGKKFPFVFSGDGSAVAVPKRDADTCAEALAAVRNWALDEFDIALRVALVPVAKVREAGFDVLIARYAPNDNVDYAMFAGGGLSWAESQMKAGAFHLDGFPDNSIPDLTGLSCRWTPMKSSNGSVLSIVAAPRKNAEPQSMKTLTDDIVQLVSRLDREGHPVMADGPGFAWPPQGLELEARSRAKPKPLWQRKLGLYFETFIAWMFFLTGIKVGGFDPKHYVATSGQNSDFRKFEDALMMTLDCDKATRDELVRILEKAQSDGLIRYGISEQDSALMTCIVPSIMTDDHVHFVDGAAGGYAKAAAQIKNQKV